MAPPDNLPPEPTEDFAPPPDHDATITNPKRVTLRKKLEANDPETIKIRSRPHHHPFSRRQRHARMRAPIHHPDSSNCRDHEITDRSTSRFPPDDAARIPGCIDPTKARKPGCINSTKARKPGCINSTKATRPINRAHASKNFNPEPTGRQCRNQTTPKFENLPNYQ